MIFRQLAIGFWALFLGATSSPAQTTNLQQQIEQLQQKLQQAQESFERTVREHQRTIEALRGQIEALQKSSTATPAPPKPGQPDRASPATVAPPAQVESKRWSPTDGLRLQRGNAYMDIGLVGTIAAGGSTARDIEGGTQLGGHDPNQRGFTLQGLEANFAGAVDPYFRGNANVVFQIDAAGESQVEVEEAYLETLSLPAKLQLRAGQFLTEFGRHNPTHPHTWSFVDTPLVLGRFLGPDGLRNVGARLGWLAPTPFYSELFLAVQDSHGGTAFSFRNEHEGELFAGRPHHRGTVHGLDDLLITPRYAAAFDLTSSQTLLLGASAAFGPNASGVGQRTQVYGVDLFWKWKSPRHRGGFPFVAWQTELLLRRYEAGFYSNDSNGNGLLDPWEEDVFGSGAVRTLSGETLTDYGLYSQVTWGFTKGWVAGLRGDYVTRRQAEYERLYGDDPARGTRWRISPSLTWYPSEYSKIRLQYNFDERDHFGPDHSIWLQLEFLLGAHAAHKF